MATKNASRAVWVLMLAVLAFVLLYASLAGRPPRPQPQDEFPSEEAPPTT